MTQLILGSTSPFRKELLEKFNIPFTCAKPNIDESALENETPEQLVARLALQKAEKVSDEFSSGLIIGSDQVALCDGNVLGKPGNFDNAVQQLSSFSGKTVTFLTGLCLLNAETKNSQVIVEPFYVTFRELTLDEIQAYVNAEQPFNCAGSFKSEGLGICLFESLKGEDPNTLIGLPLIRLHQLLKNEGFDVLANQKN
ncbi:Maf family protein [Thalassomonas sp. M1454]|uniref:Maf family protein n=1 Tax=Thalassomonas sp. M1454 TaxID=2594477 RepID=UPI00117F44B3|nr:nucleoside triphosphate pyrophosphatase [Thalassomonas sp. M1454]TRX56640.1 septum formation inhibitor Maf [Thalassomonas sp. M1454]